MTLFLLTVTLHVQYSGETAIRQRYLDLHSIRQTAHDHFWFRELASIIHIRRVHTHNFVVRDVTLSVFTARFRFARINTFTIDAGQVIRAIVVALATR